MKGRVMVRAMHVGGIEYRIHLCGDRMLRLNARGMLSSIK